jgi:hypothetical protein
MTKQEILKWLLNGDVAIQYQTKRDLLNINDEDLQNRIAREGWGSQFLSQRKSNGHWGDRFYQPKWISTHYTLLDLRNLNIKQDNQSIKDTINMTLDTYKADDGGIQLGPSTSNHSDVCVNGMFLNYASYFKSGEQKLESIVDSILNEIMADGGFNCRTTRSGATHSSLHSTISVLEGFATFQKEGYTYRKTDLKRAIQSAQEFILLHQLFISDRTGKIIKNEFLKLSYPSRWKYDILRALDYFQYAGGEWDDRMKPAIDVILKKRRKDGAWNVQAAHPGKVHVEMEKAGKSSRWNTLRVLRVLKHFQLEDISS